MARLSTPAHTPDTCERCRHTSPMVAECVVTNARGTGQNLTLCARCVEVAEEAGHDVEYAERFNVEYMRFEKVTT